MATASMFGGSPRTDVIADLPALRAASRRPSGIPVGTAAIGTTVSPRSAPACHYLAPSVSAKFLGLTDEQAKAWQPGPPPPIRALGRLEDADLGRQQTFTSCKTSCCARSAAAATRSSSRRWSSAWGCLAAGSPAGHRADRISNPSGGSNTADRTDGVECSADTGEPSRITSAAATLATSTGGPRTWGASPPAAPRPGASTRCTSKGDPPWPAPRRSDPLGPVLEPLRQLSRFAQAELDAAVNSALFALFAGMDRRPSTRPSPRNRRARSSSAREVDRRIQSGQIMNLLPGESHRADIDRQTRSSTRFPLVRTADRHGHRHVSWCCSCPAPAAIVPRGRAAHSLAHVHGLARGSCGSTSASRSMTMAVEEVAAGPSPRLDSSPTPSCAPRGLGAWVGDGPGSIDPGGRSTRQRRASGSASAPCKGREPGLRQLSTGSQARRPCAGDPPPKPGWQCQATRRRRRNLRLNPTRPPTSARRTAPTACNFAAGRAADGSR